MKSAGWTGSRTCSRRESVETMGYQSVGETRLEGGRSLLRLSSPQLEHERARNIPSGAGEPGLSSAAGRGCGGRDYPRSSSCRAACDVLEADCVSLGPG